eukprot:TRINITY_DN66864_c5_g2_i1.p2 TRINITY_DN66864_c5_g2~~TRINITY_DN66864_c5_g2_i1.p2  ORF type:complete len:245 (-),score=123.77 TRINITY_DN66864_c5_g2_i1:61-705(-)
MKTLPPLFSLDQGGADVYTVACHPGSMHVASGGFDKKIHLFDIETQRRLRTVGSHSGAVCDLAFAPHGSVMVSGGKDSRVRFFDVLSGSCIKTLPVHGEVTSVNVSSNGLYLLTSAKGNATRLWDVRMLKPLQRYKHRHASKHFIRSSFGPAEALVLGGSEDGLFYVWNVQTGEVLQRLAGHRDVVYEAKFDRRAGVFATCSHDRSLKTWTWTT